MKRNSTASSSHRLSRSPETPHSPLTVGRLKPARATGTCASRTATMEHSVLASPIRFEFFHPAARRVCVAGSFNHWNPSATPLVPLGHGRWLRQLWLPPGRYEYLFVADGVWCFDPLAPDYVPNVYGTMNAVIEVCAAANRANGSRPRNLPAPFGKKTSKNVRDLLFSNVSASED